MNEKSSQGNEVEIGKLITSFNNTSFAYNLA